ncbi:MAG: hypothetical protein KatS3mg032_0313 [Cyclobacteriaceae bacterium]|nr:MAG: hypothetical protein KatS3mg032_0313 [Cyclobacteriaceae bacterium]
MMLVLKRALGFFAGFCLLLVATLNIWVVQATRHRVFHQVEALPPHKVGLVPGTSHRLSSGNPNTYFHERMNAAAALYHAGKIKHVIVSGDNRSKYYNEPLEMKKALVARGVPAAAITSDYAGLRTLDSIVRSKKIFGQEQLVIITQPAHAYRALFICQFEGIEAVALAAGPEKWNNVALREILARPMAVLDLYIFKTKPRFLGKPEILPLTE